MFISSLSSIFNLSSGKSSLKFQNAYFVILCTIVLSSFPLPIIASELHNNLRNKCESQCVHSGRAGNFEEGKSYFYVFETETKTQLLHAKSDETSVVNLKGYVVLSAISSCFFDLSLVSLRSQINLQSSSAHKTSSSGYVSRPLVQHSLRFRLENGTIQQVCTVGNDSFWSKNIKKAVISLLQVPHFAKDQNSGVIEQNDISGKCQVFIEKQGNSYYKKTDLNLCSYREFGPSFLNGVPFDSPGARFHAVPLLNSTSSCKQDIYDGIVQTSVCHEEHVLNSLAPGSPTVRTSLNSSITFVSTRNNFELKGLPTDYVPSSPYFQHGPEETNDEIKTTPADVSALKATLLNICEEFVSQDVSPKLNLSSTMAYVKRLKQQFPKVDTDNLKNIYEEIDTGQLCTSKKEKLTRLFLKAGLKSMSRGTIGLVTSLLLEKKELNEELQQEFFEGIKFTKKPSRQSLPILENLVLSLENEQKEYIDKNQADFLLASSAFAYQYCKIVNNNCESTREYNSIVDAIAAFTLNSLYKLNQPPDHTDDTIKSVILGLHALGNLNHLTRKAIDVIGRSLASKSNRIKIHALSAFRRDPCISLKRKATNLLNTLTSGSDVRIHSYLALMRCLEEDDLEGLQMIIDNEQSNQVTSFIYSHISNQLESSSPGKEPLKSLLRKIHFDKDLPNYMATAGKYSKNIEWSGFYKESSMGFSSESNIVYSQNSYIPRTANLNLTLDLFGRSYNVIEGGMYLEKFEFILNQLYAPRANAPGVAVHLDYENVDEVDILTDEAAADYETNEIPKASSPSQEKPEPEQEEQSESKRRINPTFGIK